MKKILMFCAVAFAATLSFSQDSSSSKSYLSASVDGGVVLNSDADKIYGLGGTVTYAAQDILFGSDKNYTTITFKGFNNPYDGGSFVSSIGNNKNDALNYISFLLGYRFVKDDFENGFYFEPRVGIVQAADFSGVMVSPKIGYVINRFDVSAFADGAYGGGENNIGEDFIFTAGLSLGYQFKLFNDNFASNID